MKKPLQISLVIASFVFFAHTVFSQQISFAPNEVIVKFKSNVQDVQAQQTFADAGLAQTSFISQLGLYVCNITNQASVQNAVAACRSDDNVEYAEPNYLVFLDRQSDDQVFPNDKRFKSLWGLHNRTDQDIDAPEAWAVQKGDKKVIVAVIDTGVDYDHQDLRDNMWRNPGETGTDAEGKDKAKNKKDDDGNGFVDDVYGWNFQRGSNDPTDPHSHGTHVSGTIGAVGNNEKGIVGVNWQVSIMAMRFIAPTGSGTTDDAIKSIIYAVDNGAHILNNSWGSNQPSQALSDAIAYARDRNVIFVAAAGNDDRDTDLYAHYPSGYEHDNIISVAATDGSDSFAGFSNTGVKTVDLAAPGVAILSTTPNDGYSKFDGTSMAAPHVSGVAALVLGQYPGLTYRQVQTRMYGGVDYKSGYKRFLMTSGRLNAHKPLSTNPLIAFVTDKKDTLDTEGPYLVQADAVDDVSIQSMTLFYTVNDGQAQSQNMQNSGGDTFSAGIPGQARDAKISYYIEATDNDGNKSQTPTSLFRIRQPGKGGCCGGPGVSVASAETPGEKAMVLFGNVFVLGMMVWGVGRIKK